METIRHDPVAFRGQFGKLPRAASSGAPYGTVACVTRYGGGIIPGENIVADLNKEENVAVTKSSFNVANVIAAIALLLLVLGILKFMGVSPI
jgi:hypothetical protein